MLAEKGAWDFVAKEKPGFKFTSVNPNYNIGSNHSGATTTSTNGWVAALAQGDTKGVEQLGSQYFINVVDVARPSCAVPDAFRCRKGTNFGFHGSIHVETGH